MAILTVANISDGTDTVATGYMINGSAKAWNSFIGTGVVTIHDSLNVSSLVDNGTGDYTSNFFVDFASDHGDNATSSGQHCRLLGSVDVGFIRVNPLNSSHNASDETRIMCEALGDLA